MNRFTIILIGCAVIVLTGVWLGFSTMRNVDGEIEVSAVSEVRSPDVRHPGDFGTDSGQESELLQLALSDPARFDSVEPSAQERTTEPSRDDSSAADEASEANNRQDSPEVYREWTPEAIDAARSSRRVAGSYASLRDESIRDADSPRNIQQRQRLMLNVRASAERFRGAPADRQQDSDASEAP